MSTELSCKYSKTSFDDVDVIIPNAPTYYPKNFQRTGVLRERNHDRTLEISGLKYFYGINIKVNSTSSQFSSISNISLGTNLGFSFVADQHGQLFLTEVWIIPSSAVFDNDIDQ